jgi:hypothetical protein
MDLTIQSKRVPAAANESSVYETAWCIDDFPQLMESFTQDAALKPQIIAIRLPGGGGHQAVLTLGCLPRHYTLWGTANQICVTLKAKLEFVSTRPNNNAAAAANLMASLSFGLLDSQGKEELHKTVITRHGSEHTQTLLRQGLLDKAGSLLPAGRLTIFVRAAFLDWHEEARGGGGADAAAAIRMLSSGQPMMMMMNADPDDDLFETLLASFVDFQGLLRTRMSPPTFFVFVGPPPHLAQHCLFDARIC